MKLGQGGMADVYLAVSRSAPGLERLAVIKRLRTDLLTDQDEDAQDAEHFASMFRDEARLAVLLKHANIVHTYDVFEEEGTLHLVMEYVEGQSLNVLQRELAKKQQPLARGLAAMIVAEVLAGLHYAHELTDITGEKLNIVHRDVSPQNVLVGYDGTVKLVDFGVAKASFRSSQTRAGTMKGKARYMAPEQVINKNVDRRADVYSAGVMLWELFTGRKLISGANMFEQLVNVIKVPAPRLSSELPDIDPKLDHIVDKALARDPAARFATASEMREALLEYVASAGNVQPKEIGALVSETFASQREKLQAIVRTRLTAPEAGASAVGAPSDSNLSAAFVALDTDDLRSMGGKTTSASGSRVVGSSAGTGSGSGSGASARIILGTESSGPPSSASKPAVSASTGPVSGVESIRPAAPRSRRPIVIGALLVLLGASVFAGVYTSRAKPPASPETAATAKGEAPAPEPPVAKATAANTMAPAASASPAEPTSEPNATAAAATPPPTPRGPVYVPAARGAAASPHVPAKQSPTESTAPTPAAPAAAPAEAAGYLTLDTYPWTKVSVDGKPVGSTPLVRVSLPPGTHTVVMENPGEGIRETTTIVVKSGETTSKRLAFDSK
ncbi:MAG: hypothetical protein BGO98_03395 [Myxococcales bacterium 68-20]|nr:MAG: hypothetical protein BGO98_03395 [Myxococcales bacterium 68-20]